MTAEAVIGILAPICVACFASAIKLAREVSVLSANLATLTEVLDRLNDLVRQEHSERVDSDNVIHRRIDDIVVQGTRQ